MTAIFVFSKKNNSDISSHWLNDIGVKKGATWRTLLEGLFNVSVNSLRLDYTEPSCNL